MFNLCTFTPGERALLAAVQAAALIVAGLARAYTLGFYLRRAGLPEAAARQLAAAARLHARALVAVQRAAFTALPLVGAPR